MWQEVGRAGLEPTTGGLLVRSRPLSTLQAGGPAAPRRRVLPGQGGTSRDEPGPAAGRWRAVVPPGLIPGDGTATTLGSWDLRGLMDQLDEIYPADGGEPGGKAG